MFRERDEFEIALCREALRRDLPVLAICRGHQLLNVATGGTLVQDIPSQVAGAGAHDPDVERWETCHDVRILPGTRLREILGTEKVAVNSFHHQAVKELGRGPRRLRPRARDGVMEGIEMPRPAKRFVIGVQWHPGVVLGPAARIPPLFQALVTRGGRIASMMLALIVAFASAAARQPGAVSGSIASRRRSRRPRPPASRYDRLLGRLVRLVPSPGPDHLRRSRVVKLITTEFVAVKIDTEGGKRTEEIATKYNVQPCPRSPSSRPPAARS